MGTEATGGRSGPSTAATGGLPVFARLIDNVERVILGKREVIETVVAGVIGTRPETSAKPQAFSKIGPPTPVMM